MPFISYLEEAIRERPSLKFARFTNLLLTPSRSKPTTRTFNTSRALKAVKDNSTIDFAYMPTIADTSPAAKQRTRMPSVPLMPDNYLSAANAATTPEPSLTTSPAGSSVAAVVRNPEIALASLGSAVAALSEADGGAAADTLGLTSDSAAVEEPGAVSQVWNGFLDDVLGPKTSA